MSAKYLTELFNRLIHAPSDWFGSGGSGFKEIEKPHLESLPCSSFAELVDCWKDTRNEPDGKKGALIWSDSIDYAFSVMLAVVASTQQQGAQVWVRTLGPPGSVKTTLCEAITAADRHVLSMSMFTGFHSGQSGSEIFDKINGKTVVINEGDMLVHAPNRDQILAQIRDMWSGRVRAQYRNGVAYDIAGLRCTWIVAGTSTLRKLNRSAAGDRFLDCVVYERKVKGAPDNGEMALLRRVAEMAASRTASLSNGEAKSQDAPEKIKAMQMTAGFVEWLRENSPQKIEALRDNINDFAYLSCVNLAQLVAYMRARPDEKAEGDETEVELATRLTEQFVRLGMCLAVVLDRPTIDAEVLRRLALVAKDTCKGRSLTICEYLEEKPLDKTGLVYRTGYKPDTVAHYLTVLKTIGCIKVADSTTASGAKGRANVYRLTPQMTGLMKKLKSLLNPLPTPGKKTAANA